MSDSAEQCPVCLGAVERVKDGKAERFEHRLTVGEVALCLDNQAVVQELAQLLPAELKVAIAAELLGTRSDADPFFTVDDVRDVAESAARCDQVQMQLRARRQFDEAAAWSLSAKRQRKLAIRVAQLLNDEDRQTVLRQIHGSPLADAERPAIEVVKS
ncbi:MAG TPA: hypothetical protein VJO33_17150 [Gemmatimonadaceae bacterium]|nr:hypothetical protein [Gemmatimonadaceae bacterium]